MLNIKRFLNILSLDDFIDAVKDNDIELVTAYLSSHPEDINRDFIEEDGSRVNALTIALKSGLMEMTELLVNSGARDNIQFKDLARFIGIAFDYGKPNVARLLINVFNRHNTILPSREDQITYLALNLNPLRIISSDEWLNWYVDFFDKSILDEVLTRLVTTNRNGYNIESLISHGANPNLITHDGNTLLNIAEQNNNLFMMTELLKLGARAYSRNNVSDRSILEVSKGYYKKSHELISEEHKMTDEGPVVTIRYKCNIHFHDFHELLRFKIDNNADVNACDHEGITPLMNASQNGLKHSAYELIKHGADVNKKDANGNNVLMHLCYNTSIQSALEFDTPYRLEMGSWEIIDNLMAKEELINELAEKIDINETNNHGDTALMIALRNNKSSLAKLLLRLGAKTHFINEANETAMTLCQDSEIMKKLVEIEKSLEHHHAKIDTLVKKGVFGDSYAAFNQITAHNIEKLILEFPNIKDPKVLINVLSQIANFTAILAGSVDEHTKHILEDIAKLSRKAAARFGDSQSKDIVDNFYEEKKDEALSPMLEPRRPMLVFSNSTPLSLEVDEEEVKEPINTYKRLSR